MDFAKIFEVVGNGASMVSAALDFGLTKSFRRILNLGKKLHPGTDGEENPTKARETKPDGANTKVGTTGVDSFGKADDRGLIGLMALYGIKPVTARDGRDLFEVTLQQRVAFGYFLEALTPGELGALLRILALAGTEPVQISYTWRRPGTTPDAEGEPVTRTHQIQAAGVGVHIIRAIADDILSADPNDKSVQHEAAVQTATMIRKLNILDNLRDDAIEIWVFFLDKFFDAVMLKDVWEIVGCTSFRTVETLLTQPYGRQLVRAVLSTDGDAGTQARYDLVHEYLAPAAKQILLLPKDIQRRDWGMPSNNRARWILLGLILSLAAIFYAMSR